MSDLSIFRYEGADVRTVVVDGEPWFVASDVASILEYSATSAMTRRLDDDDKGVRVLHTLGGPQAVTIISESGLYAAIFGSQSSRAQEFKRKVTHEILPAIRKHGVYATPDAVEAMLSERALKLDVVIELVVDDKALVGRIVKRAEQARAAGQPVRKDDNGEVFEERLREYYKKTSPLIG